MLQGIALTAVTTLRVISWIRWYWPSGMVLPSWVRIGSLSPRWRAAIVSTGRQILKMTDIVIVAVSVGIWLLLSSRGMQ